VCVCVFCKNVGGYRREIRSLYVFTGGFILEMRLSRLILKVIVTSPHCPIASDIVLRMISCLALV
jgi:hypothetical protein